MTARTVLVTGGSSGIGAAAVRRFAAAGDEVWFTYRSGKDRAARLVDEVGGQAFAFDQGAPESHQALLAELPGPVDVLVNNAGLGSKTVEAYAPGDPRAQDLALLQVDAAGPLWITQDLLPGMLAQGRGTVIFVASVGGGISQFPGFRHADGMAKAAVAYLTRHLAAEHTHTPIDVFGICPGAVETPMFTASTLEGLTAEDRTQLEQRLPKGRLIQAAEIAEVLWWLSTPAARVLHGAVLDASMGLGVHPGLLTGGS
ncbi:SDR family NAD(P)-dependent oxidoreductase [Kribbella deserti]|uniref:SDR family NAD(P)-dependent oxidoreductase n=1 Tax=Kribbella deserti TaxID=1926257 RepID=A0ABV6QWW4_9ACTN